MHNLKIIDSDNLQCIYTGDRVGLLVGRYQPHRIKETIRVNYSTNSNLVWGNNRETEN